MAEEIGRHILSKSVVKVFEIHFQMIRRRTELDKDLRKI